VEHALSPSTDNVLIILHPFCQDFSEMSNWRVIFFFLFQRFIEAETSWSDICWKKSSFNGIQKYFLKSILAQVFFIN